MLIHWSWKERLRSMQDCSAPLSKHRTSPVLPWLCSSCLSQLMAGVWIMGSMCCCTGLWDQGKVRCSENWCWIGALGLPWPTSSCWFLFHVMTLAKCQSKVFFIIVLFKICLSWIYFILYKALCTASESITHFHLSISVNIYKTLHFTSD